MQPFKVTREQVDTLSNYDYRGRTVETIQQTAGTGKTLSSTRTCINNMLFSESESDGKYSGPRTTATRP